MLHLPRRAAPFVAGLLLACSGWGGGGALSDGTAVGRKAEEGSGRSVPSPILASNAFFYYEDLEAAHRFYRDVLGVRTVADYGFARILHVAPTSYLILVDEEQGMHSADEPKSVTLSLIVDDLEGWWSHLEGRGLEVVEPFEPSNGRAQEAFVVRDPEGYTLELLRVNDHPEVEPLRSRLESLRPLRSGAVAETTRPPGLGIRGTVLWLYYQEPDSVLEFYRDALGLDPLLSEPWGHTLQASSSGFLGLGRAGAGLHEATDETGVTASFWVRDVDAWFRHMDGRSGFELRTPEVVVESGLVRVFVGYDPAGRFLEWDTFLDGEENRDLIPLLYPDGNVPVGE